MVTFSGFCILWIMLDFAFSLLFMPLFSCAPMCPRGGTLPVCQTLCAGGFKEVVTRISKGVNGVGEKGLIKAVRPKRLPQQTHELCHIELRSPKRSDSVGTAGLSLKASSTNCKRTQRWSYLASNVHSSNHRLNFLRNFMKPTIAMNAPSELMSSIDTKESPFTKDPGIAAPSHAPPKNNKIPPTSNIHGTLSIGITVATR